MDSVLSIQVVLKDDGCEVIGNVPGGDKILRDDLRWCLRDYQRRRRRERITPLTQRVLEALVGLWELDHASHQKPNLQVGRIAQMVGFLDQALGEREPEELSARRIGHILRQELRFRTKRAHPADDPNRAYRVVWEQKHVEALCNRFGLDDQRIEMIVTMLQCYRT